MAWQEMHTIISTTAAVNTFLYHNPPQAEAAAPIACLLALPDTTSLHFLAPLCSLHPHKPQAPFLAAPRTKIPFTMTLHKLKQPPPNTGLLALPGTLVTLPFRGLLAASRAVQNAEEDGAECAGWGGGDSPEGGGCAGHDFAHQVGAVRGLVLPGH